MSEAMPKSDWGPGPWQSEPDTLDWRDERTGLACAIRRNSDVTGALCGYVGVPPGHAFHGWSYDDNVKLLPADLEGSIDDVGAIPAFCYAVTDEQKNGTIPLGMVLKVHGGITFAGEGYDGMSSGLWWFGFDCSHAGDVSPAIIALLRKLGHDHHFGEKYRDIEYVKKEVASLAFQLRQQEVRQLAA